MAIKCGALGNQILSVLEEPEYFLNRKEEISSRVFGTQSQFHPSISKIKDQGDNLISGKRMRFFTDVNFNDGMDQYRLSPI